MTTLSIIGVYFSGKQTFGDGTVYEGDFNEDMRHGDGVISWPNGEVRYFVFQLVNK